MASTQHRPMPSHFPLSRSQNKPFKPTASPKADGFQSSYYNQSTVSHSISSNSTPPPDEAVLRGQFYLYVLHGRPRIQTLTHHESRTQTQVPATKPFTRTRHPITSVRAISISSDNLHLLHVVINLQSWHSYLVCNLSHGFLNKPLTR